MSAGRLARTKPAAAALKKKQHRSGARTPGKSGWRSWIQKLVKAAELAAAAVSERVAKVSKDAELKAEQARMDQAVAKAVAEAERAAAAVAAAAEVQRAKMQKMELDMTSLRSQLEQSQASAARDAVVTAGSGDLRGSPRSDDSPGVAERRERAKAMVRNLLAEKRELESNLRVTQTLYEAAVSKRPLPRSNQGLTQRLFG